MDDGFVEAGNSTSGKTWDKTGILIGTYVEKKEDVGQNNSNMYMIQVAGEDELTAVWGSTVLDEKFDDIPMNSIVKIEHLGKEKTSKGFNVSKYKVMYKEPEDKTVPDTKELDAATGEDDSWVPQSN